MKIKYFVTGIFVLLALVLMAVAIPTYAVEDTDDDTNNDEEVVEEETYKKLPEQASARAHRVQGCLQISRVLRQGASGEEVEELQQFLKDSGYFSHDEITGYFGPLTEEAVKRFQAKQGLVAGGTPETTGYGQIGPKTRAQIAKKSCLTENQQGFQKNVKDDEDENEEATVEELEALIEALEEQIEDLRERIEEIKAEEEEADEEEEEEEENTIEVEITADPDEVNENGSTTLQWESENAYLCTSDDFETDDDTNGTMVIEDITEEMTFTVTCENEDGTEEESDSVTVTVTEATE
jgi:peptidoglycan hydrolase-like protein with peptidoglycan-binding domain